MTWRELVDGVRAREADGVTADADSAAAITACIIAGDCASADKPRKMSFERVSPGRASEKDE